MSIDLYAKSQQLLESLANSIHDRDRQTPNPFTFNITDIQLTEKWLEGFVHEVKQALAEY